MRAGRGETRRTLEGAHHHEALGHAPSPGEARDPAACALCEAVDRKEPLDTGETHLLGVGDDPLPVEYVVRHVHSGAYGEGSVITIRDLRERRALETERRVAEAAA